MGERPYQAASRVMVQGHWDNGDNRVILALPTGAGKTWSAVRVLDRYVRAGARVLWLAHLDLLLTQAAQTLTSAGHTPFIWRGKYIDRTRFVHLASMQRLGFRLDRVTWEPDLIVVDEAHRSACNTYKRILERYPNAKVLGLTATPWRLDGKGLGTVGFTKIVAPVAPDWLVDNGFLVPPRVLAPRRPDVKGLRRRAGEFTAKSAAKAMEAGIGDIVRGVSKVAHEDGGRIALFAATIAQSLVIRDELRAAGVTAEHVDADTTSEERIDLLGPTGAMASGDLQVICSVGVLDEGVDCPALDSIVLATPTASSGRYLQRCGRGARTAPGKKFYRLIDYGGNVPLPDGTGRHMWPTEDLRPRYSLEGLESEDQDREAPVTQCPECQGIELTARWRNRCCPLCGWERPREEIEVEDHGLELVDVDPDLVRRMESRDAEWAELAAECNRRGYKPGWAIHRWKGRHGWSPTRPMMQMLNRRAG